MKNFLLNWLGIAGIIIVGLAFLSVLFAILTAYRTAGLPIVFFILVTLAAGYITLMESR